MAFPTRKLTRFTLGILAFLLTIAWAGESEAARRRFYVGGGLNTVAPAGGIDGFKVFTAGPDGPNVYPGKLADGSGMAVVLFGVNFLNFIAPEVLLNISTHDSSHSSFPGENFRAGYFSLYLGGRVFLPLGDSMEIFARGMGGVVGLGYEGNAEYPPSTTYSDSSFSGSGSGLGGGIRFNLEAIGIEFSYMKQMASFDHVSLDRDGQTTDFDIDPLEEDFGVVQLIVMWNFGKEL